MNLDSQTFFQKMTANAKRSKDYYIGALIASLGGSNLAARKHLNEIILAMRASLSVELPSVFDLEHRKVHLARNPKHHGCKTLIL
jgi:hypothetical protein